MTPSEPNLHGIEKLPFPDFTETATYIEGVTLNRQQAVELLLAEGFDTVEIRGIWMRWVEEIDRDNQPELDNCEAPCWVECSHDDPDALPFWKDAP